MTVVCDDTSAAKIIDLIIKTAQTGKIGDGKIFVSELSEVIRIRTAEHGTGAL
jgi:nitrogen regulatory protein PII